MSERVKPTIAVSPLISTWSEIDKLREKGYTVLVVPELGKVDLALGEVCWRMTELHRRYLPLALKSLGKEGKDRPK